MIHPDIRLARTLPAAFYKDMHPFEQFKESLFRDAWHYLQGDSAQWQQYNVIPATILPGYLDDPVLLTKDRAGAIRCISNVCTHRGNLLVDAPGLHPLIRCRYHGRCFGHDGVCRAQPGMEGHPDFPSPSDNLPSLDVKSIGPMQFVRLSGNPAFDEVFTPMLKRLAWFDFDSLVFDPARSHDYELNAHWALYVDNYLEGYHVPFVHPGLSKSLDPIGYSYELFPGAALQLGRAREGEQVVFDIPAGSQDHGEKIFAFYWWIFPNIMINIYPWGVSFNSVEPLGLESTRICFRTFSFPDRTPPDFETIHETEMEDEAIVEQVQRGIHSSFYKEGRYSPDHETAVHHFHRQLAIYLEKM